MIDVPDLGAIGTIDKSGTHQVSTCITGPTARRCCSALRRVVNNLEVPVVVWVRGKG